VPPFKSLGRGGFVLNFVVSRTSDLLLCVVANLRPHILKFARLRSTPLLHKIRRTTICGSHPIPFVKKRRLTPPFKSLGRGGFVLNFVVSRTSDLLLCVVANLRPHILKFTRLRSTPLLNKIRRTTICGSHPIPCDKKKKACASFLKVWAGVDLSWILLSLGRVICFSALSQIFVLTYSSSLAYARLHSYTKSAEPPSVVLIQSPV